MVSLVYIPELLLVSVPEVKLTFAPFTGSPFSHFKPKPVNINFFHSDEQQKVFSSYIGQFGESKQNLGTILSRSIVNSFYRNTVIGNS